MKLISESLLRQRNGLMIYSKIERVLVITKLINNYNTDFFGRNKIKSAKD